MNWCRIPTCEKQSNRPRKTVKTAVLGLGICTGRVSSVRGRSPTTAGCPWADRPHWRPKRRERKEASGALHDPTVFTIVPPTRSPYPQQALLRTDNN
eukprot:scaffold23191_cov27-Tisochrysis_lutea.AAC.4